MAYENMTYEYILHRMIDRVKTEYPNIDTREGSIIFNALAPAAIELTILYSELDNVLNESFVTTASREYLLIACEQMGMDITIFNSSAGVHKGLFNTEVPIGSRWNCDLYNYTVTEYIGTEDSNHAYRLVCETVGTAPNNTTGSLTPITDVPTELTLSEIVECLIEGENETSDDGIRVAYSDFVNSVAVDGNTKQYEQWCNSYDGIGNAKIFPLWNGDNTVKVSILSPSNRAASDELVNEFQEYLDPGCTGMGDGVAPIGAFVTVSTAEEHPVNISAKIKMNPGYSDTTKINTALSNYFASIAYEKSIVPYMNIGAIILSTEGVDSVSDLLISGGTKDIELADEVIPILGTASWTVV